MICLLTHLSSLAFFQIRAKEITELVPPMYILVILVSILSTHYYFKLDTDFHTLFKEEI